LGKSWSRQFSKNFIRKTLKKNILKRKSIYVTQPVLPELNDFISSISKIWDNKILSNSGPFHNELEEKLAQFLGVKYVSLFSNGTLGLITALQALNISGEVITTPYSFVATTHSLWWNGIKPIFVDIDEKTCNIDCNKVESAITNKTTAILAVHVYGNPCANNELQKIADKYGLKLIYDAAHAFNVKYKNTSILNYGDLSVLSFHATKVFNTIEGGAIISHDEKTKKRIDLLKNFGYSGEFEVVAPGINAKMNEIQAAYGLLQLKSINKDILKRKKLAFCYRQHLNNLSGINLMQEDENVDYNYSYMPIFIDTDLYGMSRDGLYDLLKSYNIYSRKYFYPLISEFPMYKYLESSKMTNLTISNKISSTVLCLPLYSNLDISEVEFICDLIKNKH
jgi:dTDP-4-amino-4,6-dideoxygalactose transaminase